MSAWVSAEVLADKNVGAPPARLMGREVGGERQCAATARQFADAVKSAEQVAVLVY